MLHMKKNKSWTMLNAILWIPPVLTLATQFRNGKPRTTTAQKTIVICVGPCQNAYIDVFVIGLWLYEYALDRAGLCPSYG